VFGVAHPSDHSSIPVREELLKNCHAKSRFYFINSVLVSPGHCFIFYFFLNKRKSCRKARRGLHICFYHSKLQKHNFRSISWSFRVISSGAPAQQASLIAMFQIHVPTTHPRLSMLFCCVKMRNGEIVKEC
jgi:hypothetical protein